MLQVVESGDGDPIGNAAPIFQDLAGELKLQTDRLRAVLGSGLPAFNIEATRLGREPIS